MASNPKIKQIQGLQSTLDALAGIDVIVESYTTTATNGDTGITLSLSARETDAIKIEINGVAINSGISWKKNGSIVTSDSLEAGTELVWDSSTIGYDLSNDDEITITYETLTSGNTLSGNSGIKGTVTGHLIPDNDETYDLGSSSNKFRDLYLSGNTLYMAGQPLSVVDGQLQLNGSPVTGSLDVYKTSQTSPTGGVNSQFAFSVPGCTTGASLSPTQNRVLVEDGYNIKVYRLQNGEWSQEGSDIPFFGNNFLVNYRNEQKKWSRDGSSFQVWNTSDRNTMKIYFWNGSDWQQRGSDLTYTSLRASDINEDGTKITAIDGVLKTHLWNGSSWQETTQISPSYAFSCNMSAGGSRLVSSNETGTYVWDWSGTQWVNQTLISNNVVPYGEFSGDGNALYTIDGNGDPVIYFWNGSTWNATSFIAEDGLVANAGNYLSEDGTRILISSRLPNNINGSSSNYKWSIWEYNGSSWIKSTLTRFDATRNNVTANYNITLVLGNKHIGSTEDFYIYDISNTINESSTKYLETIGAMEGEVLDVWFDTILAYDPFDTCYIYTDELNWIGCRVIQNTTSSNNLLKVKILEKLGDISSYEYSITNLPIHQSNYKKEVVSINQELSKIIQRLDTSGYTEPTISSYYVPGSSLPYSNNSGEYKTFTAMSVLVDSHFAGTSHITKNVIKLLDYDSNYKYRVGSLKGILTDSGGTNSVQALCALYLVAIINTDPTWPNGPNDSPSIFNTDAGDVIPQGVKYLILDRITVDTLSNSYTAGNSFKVHSDEADIPYEIMLERPIALFLMRTDNWTDHFSNTQHISLNYDLLHY